MKDTWGYVLVLLFISSLNLMGNNTFSVYNLSCEHESNPLGIMTLSPRFSWQINAVERNFEQSARQILVADSESALKKDNGNIWDSGEVISSSSILVPFKGKKLKAGSAYFWKVRIWDKKGNVSPWSTVQKFGMGLLSPKDWNGAKWIALENDKKNQIITLGIHGRGDDKLGNDFGKYLLPQFRKEFTVKKEIKRVVAFVSGLGHFDFFLNGKKVGNHFLDPGWTKYDRCALYVPFDISNQISMGKNVVGVMLGNGFFNIPRERYMKLIESYGAPRLLMNIRLEYQDGSVENIVTDQSWKTTGSAITYSSIYGGEDFDANKEQEGWYNIDFDDSTWKNAIDTHWNTKMYVQESAPLTVRDTIPTVRILKNSEGRYVYDLGQNFSGIIRFTVKTTSEKEIKLHPAELLNSDSTVNQSASGSPFWFGYTTKGTGIESWQPRFTYYGFRYVQLEGAVPEGMDNPEGLPVIVDLKGLHTCNSAPEVGRFHCSKPMFNKIYELIDWAIRSNMASVLTDCPHREKLGWLEQAHLMQYAIQYRYNLASLYYKKMQDMSSTQAKNGMIPTIAPELVRFADGFEDTPEWGSSFIISPWYIYQWYGDSRLIEYYYPDMQRYIDYLRSRADNNIIAYGLGDWFDIGPNSPGVSQLTSNGVTATAIYYYNVSIMEKVSCLLNKNKEALKYASLAKDIKTAFNQKFWDPDKEQYDKNSQTANAIALYVGLTTPENEKKVFQNLVTDIRNRKNALTAGDVGYRYVLRVLEMNDASNVIFDMNNKYDTPGYGWQLAHGATSLTESWQAYGFVSNNHLMLGHLMEWLFSGLGGIRQADESIGFKYIRIQPSPCGDVRNAQTSYESPYGQIISEWTDTGENFCIRVSVPANCKADVYLPTRDVGKITENGIILDKNNGWKYRLDGKYTIVETGSGNYNFFVQK